MFSRTIDNSTIIKIYVIQVQTRNLCISNSIFISDPHLPLQTSMNQTFLSARFYGMNISENYFLIGIQSLLSLISSCSKMSMHAYTDQIPQFPFLNYRNF